MALDKKDMTQFESLMIKTINDAIEQIVLPQFEEVRNDISGIKKDIGGLKEDVGGLKKDVIELKKTTSNLESSVSNLEDTSNRIERKLDIEIERNDEQSVKIDKHEKRLTKLELKKAN